MATAARPLARLALPGLAVALAALWPLSAYAVGPLALPAALLVAGAVLAIIRRPEIGIAISLVIVPLRRYEPAGLSFQPVKVLLPALAVSMLVYAALLARREGPRRTPAFVLATAAFIVLTLISALSGIQPQNSVGAVSHVLTAGVLVLATVQICRRPDQVAVLAAGAVGGLAVAGTQGDFQQALGQVSDIAFVANGVAVGRIEGSFGHPNQLAGFLAVLLPIAVALALSKRLRPSFRALAAFAAAVAVPAMLFTYTRGAIIGLGGGSLLWLAIVRPRRLALVVVVLLAGYVALGPSVLAARFKEVNSGDVSLRSDLWGAALDIYSEAPLLGVGIANFGPAYENLAVNVSTPTQLRLLHGDQVLVPPHANDLYLTWLAEGGILGLVCLLALGTLAVQTALRGTRSTDPVIRTVSLGLGAAWLTFALHNVLEITLLDVLEPMLVLTVAIAGLTSAPPGRPRRHGDGVRWNARDV